MMTHAIPCFGMWEADRWSEEQVRATEQSCYQAATLQNYLSMNEQTNKQTNDTKKPQAANKNVKRTGLLSKLETS